MNHNIEPDFYIRAATERDCVTIYSFIQELAEYERLLDQVTGTEDDVRSSFFGPGSRVEAVLALVHDVPVGFAVFFHNYSTFLCRPGLYIEDLYVRPEYRGRGFGRRLLSHLAGVARNRGCGRMEWAVLDWNSPAIGFYETIGASPVKGWTHFRIAGARLNELSGNT